jgi:peptidoglycan/xylan/chitin deacetylase (PgdA/CDA1 family)
MLFLLVLFGCSLILLVYSAPRFVVDLLATKFPFVFWKGSNNEKAKVALTIDDVPTIHTRSILNILSKHKAKATFFVIGNYAQQHPELIKEIIKQGHEIGNHTMKDFPSWKLDEIALKESIQNTEDILKEIHPEIKLKWFRPGTGLQINMKSSLTLQAGSTRRWYPFARLLNIPLHWEMFILTILKYQYGFSIIGTYCTKLEVRIAVN